MSKRKVKARAGKLDGSLTNEDEIISLVERIDELTKKFLALEGTTNVQTRANINEWLDEVELTFGEGMVDANIMAGYGGYVINANVSKISTDFDIFKQVRSADIVRLSTKDLTEARLLRNALADSVKLDAGNIYKQFDNFIKGSIGLSRNQIVNEFVNKAAFHNVVHFVDSRGRKWQPKHYSNMWARTRSREIEDEVMTIEMKENGLDVCRINDVSTTTPICLQYEGKYFSLTGATPELPILDILPPFHPNCRHRKFPVANYKSSMLNTNKAIDNKTRSLSKKWTKAQKNSIKNQEAWNLANRSFEFTPKYAKSLQEKDKERAQRTVGNKEFNNLTRVPVEWDEKRMGEEIINLNNRERVYMVAKDGRVFVKDGGSDSISFDPREQSFIKKNNIIKTMHNHPDIGGTFSQADIAFNQSLGINEGIVYGKTRQGKRYKYIINQTNTNKLGSQSAVFDKMKEAQNGIFDELNKNKDFVSAQNELTSLKEAGVTGKKLNDVEIKLTNAGNHTFWQQYAKVTGDTYVRESF
jgi:hypothetical protein